MAKRGKGWEAVHPVTTLTAQHRGLAVNHRPGFPLGAMCSGPSQDELDQGRLMVWKGLASLISEEQAKALRGSKLAPGLTDSKLEAKP